MIRDDAIIVCSCNWKIGRISRAAMHEDKRVERAILAVAVPRMVRHFRLGHTFTLQATEFGDVIAKAAQAMRTELDEEAGVEPRALLDEYKPYEAAADE